MKKSIRGLAVSAAVMMFLTGCGGGEAPQEKEDAEKESFFFIDEEELGDTRIQEYASDEEYPQLAAFLSDYYQIPEEYLQETRYYYNFADLNEDGTDEIVALTIGETTSDSDGECILILRTAGGSFQVAGDFRDARTPVLISDEMADGWHEVIYPVYGGLQETGYRKCSYQGDEGYQSGEEDFTEEVDAGSGVWILSDNLIDDWDQGDYLTLAPGS